jgi:CRP-like cAMP-binding protein
MSAPRPKNRLLAALAPEVLARLLPDLHTIPMLLKQPLHHADEPMEHVYFPNSGMASVTALLANGRMVEAATVGDEGMVGIEAVLLDAPVSPGESMVQVAGTSAEMLSVRAFRRELARHGPMEQLMGRYAQTVIAQIMHVAACNALHSVEQRCCRWLLTAHDRVRTDTFVLTQEFLSVMLGVHRPTVSTIAASLQSAGLIRYSRGQIQIVNRKGLERASCECYLAIRRRVSALWSGSSQLSRQVPRPVDGLAD